MKILLDEDVPEPFVEMLRTLLKGHVIHTVRTMKWTGRKDIPLYEAGAKKGFDVIISGNHRQLNDPNETRAIKKSGMHVVYYRQEPGLEGLGRGAGSLISSIIPVIAELDAAETQLLVTIRALSARKRYESIDPKKQPPAYWH